MRLFITLASVRFKKISMWDMLGSVTIEYSVFWWGLGKLVWDARLELFDQNASDCMGNSQTQEWKRA